MDLTICWDLLKTGWDVTKTLSPLFVRRFKLRRGTWPQWVRIGGTSLGTPAHDIDQLLEMFEKNPTAFLGETRHPLLDEIRESLWRIYQRLDELHLLAIAEQGRNIDDRCWALAQIGQRCGPYALPTLQAIAHGLDMEDRVREAAAAAVTDIQRRHPE